MGGCHQGRDLGAVVDAEFPHQRSTLLTNRLVQNDGTIGIGDRTMECARRDAKDVTTTLEPNDVERLFPGQVHQKEGSAATGREQIVFIRVAIGSVVVQRFQQQSVPHHALDRLTRSSFGSDSCDGPG